MNLALMRGMVDSMRIKGVEAILDPTPGRCCVAFQPSPRGGTETEEPPADEAAS
jgi:hypothetical protein